MQGQSAIVRSVVAGALCALFLPGLARALPSFGIQTNQPCSSCHISAFGPMLKQAGRDFKLYGYSASDMQHHSLPFAIVAEGTFAHVDEGELPNGTATGSQNRGAVEGGSLYYGGKIVNDVGAFVELNWEAVPGLLHWQDADIRYARDGTFKGHDVVYGVTVNNAPTVDDLWEASPAWIFPFVASSYQPSPLAAPLIDDLSSLVFGAGGYAMWDDTLYTEIAGYGGLNHDELRLVGEDMLNGSDSTAGVIPYGRLVLQHEFLEGQHYAAIGVYGMHADVAPHAVGGFGDDSYTDLAVDGTYQWIAHPELSVSDVVSAHLLVLHENEALNASRFVLGTKSSDDLSVFRGDVTYSWDATITPTLQYFSIWGSADPARWDTLDGCPDSRGVIAEVDFVPWGKPDSPFAWLNARLALQYIAYSEFDGSTRNASDNNTVLLDLMVGAALNR